MLRALLAVALFATAICGVKGAPRPPEQVALSNARADAGAPGANSLAPEDAGCADGG